MRRSFKTPRVRAWRKAVLQRCNFTCDISGVVSRRLQGHHLNCWAKFPKERYDPNNGIALTHHEHFLFHNYMGGPYVACTRRDYECYRVIRIREKLTYK